MPILFQISDLLLTKDLIFLFIVKNVILIISFDVNHHIDIIALRYLTRLFLILLRNELLSDHSWSSSIGRAVDVDDVIVLEGILVC